MKRLKGGQLWQANLKRTYIQLILSQLHIGMFRSEELRESPSNEGDSWLEIY